MHGRVAGADEEADLAGAYVWLCLGDGGDGVPQGVRGVRWAIRARCCAGQRGPDGAVDAAGVDDGAPVALDDAPGVAGRALQERGVRDQDEMRRAVQGLGEGVVAGLDDGYVGGGQERGQCGGEPVDGQVRQRGQGRPGVVGAGDGDEPGGVPGIVQAGRRAVDGGEEPVAVAVVELVAARAAVDDHEVAAVAAPRGVDLLGGRDPVDVADG